MFGEIYHVARGEDMRRENRAKNRKHGYGL
jgi:hypothetical protein